MNELKGKVLALDPGHIAVKIGNTFGVIETDSPVFLIEKGFAKTGLKRPGSGLFFGITLPKVVKDGEALLSRLRAIISPEIITPETAAEGESKVDEPEAEVAEVKAKRRSGMAVEVKRGGREAYTCAECGKQIPPKETHWRMGGKPFKRYHTKCLKDDKKVEVSTTVG